MRICRYSTVSESKHRLATPDNAKLYRSSTNFENYRIQIFTIGSSGFPCCRGPPPPPPILCCEEGYSNFWSNKNDRANRISRHRFPTLQRRKKMSCFLKASNVPHSNLFGTVPLPVSVPGYCSYVNIFWDEFSVKIKQNKTENFTFHDKRNHKKIVFVIWTVFSKVYNSALHRNFH